MALRWNSVVGLLCGWGSAVVWSIGLTVFQPDTEPGQAVARRVRLQQCLGGAATAIVGNPPVNAADEDVLYSVAGLAGGLVFGAVSLAAGRMRRPVSTSLPHAVR